MENTILGGLSGLTLRDGRTMDDFSRELRHLGVGINFEGQEYGVDAPKGWSSQRTVSDPAKGLVSFLLIDDRKRGRAQVDAFWAGIGGGLRLHDVRVLSRYRIEINASDGCVNILDLARGSDTYNPKVLHRVPFRPLIFGGLDACIKDAEGWLGAHFPEWSDPVKYWDEGEDASV